MKKIGDKPLTQAELTRRYYENNDLVLFATRIERKYAEKLNERLRRYGVSKKEFLTNAIKQYLRRGD